jgi:aldehyde dehydrogenase (NAD+)
MREQKKFYIDGRWVDPLSKRLWEVVNPATEQVSGVIALGGDADVDAAVVAARRAFPAFSATTREERLQLLENFGAEYEKRLDDVSAAISEEMGAPSWLAQEAQSKFPLAHLEIAIATLKNFDFEREHGGSRIVHRPIGVCGLITPWNWPMAMGFTKLLPALAVGCTSVLKPSEFSPYSAQILAEVVDAAGVPPGVFNLVYGDGPTVGTAISGHPGIDMVSITGSTRAGAEVARAAAGTIKRVHQELGGKSPNVILESADLPGAVSRGIAGLMINSGQNCQGPSRMLVPRARREEAFEAAREAIAEVTVGTPEENCTTGPVVNGRQFERIQRLIQAGIDEDATLVAGGPGRPEGSDTGFLVRPTVLGDVTPEMTVAREEIFGPVLVMQPYADLDDAIRIANATEYGLAAYVQGGDIEEVRAVARRIPAGQVYLNGSGLDVIDLTVPFGGMKRSGNGREWGAAGFEAFLETMSLVGYEPTAAAS